MAVGIVTVTLCLAGIVGLMLYDYAAQRREDRRAARILTEDGVRADLPVVRIEVDEDSRAEPSSVVPRGSRRSGREVCMLDDPGTLDQRHMIGIDHILFETDFPHADSTWPNSQDLLRKRSRASPTTRRT